MLGAKEGLEVSRVALLDYRWRLNNLYEDTELYFTLLLSIREALKMMSTLLQAAGHLLISSAAVIRRIIQGADMLQAQNNKQIVYWE